MKEPSSDELPLGNSQLGQRKTSNFILVAALTIFLLTIIPLYCFPSYPFNPFRYVKSVNDPTVADDLPFQRQSSANLRTAGDRREADDQRYWERGKIVIPCDLSRGEWVPNPDAPYYTNATCDAIQEHQNCMKYGRPDLEFLKWRWKPDGCDLPVFDPHGFLQLVAGKSMVFVGDSLARNHMQSLICLLSKVAHPTSNGNPTVRDKVEYHYTEYNFTISFFFTRFLIRSENIDPYDATFRLPFNLFLDEFDETWTAKIESFHYIIISAGTWFPHPSYFYLNRTLIGCLYCSDSNVIHLNLQFGYRWAFRTALKAISDSRNFSGVGFLRTFSPSHFEGGAWNSGGDCMRRMPYRRNETVLEHETMEMYKIQVEEMRIAQRSGGRGTGGKFRLLDVTRPMLLRPDGHPSKYGRSPVVNQTFYNDCVHWCLPGPVDVWNDLLLQLIMKDKY